MMQDYIDGARIANAVMQDTTFVGTHLIVEGQKDQQLFEKFVDSESCLISIGQGFENVINAISILNARNFNRHLGIIDADFRNLHQSDASVFENLIYTDYHDMEMVIIHSPAFDHVIRLLGQKEKLKEFESDKKVKIRDHVLSIIAPLGYLKFYSYIEGLKMPFKSKNQSGNLLRYSRFIERHTFVYLGDNSMIDAAINYCVGKMPVIPKKDKILKGITGLRKNRFDLTQLCNGHDFCHALEIGLNRVLGSKNIDAEAIQDALILAYDSRYFIKTKLYGDIKDWESNHVPLIILSF